VLFQNEEKGNILKEAYRILRPEGRVLIMEWGDNLLVGPDKKKRISREKMERLANDQGFIIKKNIPAGNFHYALVIEK
jgi:ubiquinone/menaquinone biosynthesis C-methylase UbiE